MGKFEYYEEDTETGRPGYLNVPEWPTRDGELDPGIDSYLLRAGSLIVAAAEADVARVESTRYTLQRTARLGEIADFRQPFIGATDLELLAVDRGHDLYVGTQLFNKIAELTDQEAGYPALPMAVYWDDQEDAAAINTRTLHQMTDGLATHLRQKQSEYFNVTEQSLLIDTIAKHPYNGSNQKLPAAEYFMRSPQFEPLVTAHNFTRALAWLGLETNEAQANFNGLLYDEARETTVWRSGMGLKSHSPMEEYQHLRDEGIRLSRLVHLIGDILSISDLERGVLALGGMAPFRKRYPLVKYAAFISNYACRSNPS